MEGRDAAGMVDITDKASVRRTASACGLIKLKASSVAAIASGRVKKGDVIATARAAALLAVKDTPRMIPFCHPIPITAVDVEFELAAEAVSVIVTVSSVGKTGVEMEALAGVAAALLNIWDMVKMLEKDESGNYPSTEIYGIKVLEKRKETI